MKKYLKLFKSPFVIAPFISGIVSLLVLIGIVFFAPTEGGVYQDWVGILLLTFLFIGLVSASFFTLSLLFCIYLMSQPKKGKKKIGHFVLGTLLLGILNITFFLLMLNFLDVADGLGFEEKAEVGRQNLLKIVFFYGFFTFVFVFISFWKRFFRGVAVSLIMFWLIGTFVVAMISIYGPGTAFQQETTSYNDKIISDVSQCSESQSINSAKYCSTLIIRDDGAHGSAFSIYDNYLITNKHVVEGARELKTYIGETEVPATLWNYSPSYDLAILKIPDGLSTCKWFDSNRMQVAETVYTVGWPLDTFGESTVSKGIFSRVLESDEGNYIQTDASINSGNSGGPLINKCGVVGINTAKIEEVGVEGLGFVLPSSELIPVVEQLIKEGSDQTEIPLAATDYGREYVPPQTTQYFINVEDVKFYLTEVVAAKNSWSDCGNCSQDDLSRLFDLFDRQIAFCNTLIERLSDGRRPSQDDICMWDSVVKMSYESAAIAARLNSR